MESYAIITIQNKGFVYAQGKRPLRVSGLAHKTLEAIDTILRNNLPCLSEKAPDLYALATNIQTRYLRKTRKLSWIRRFFGRVAQKERSLQALVTCLPTTRLITSLPAEIVQYICSFIVCSPWELARLSRVSRLFRGAVGAVRSQALLPFAREWGCRTDDPIAYLQALFQEFRSNLSFWQDHIWFNARPLVPLIWPAGLFWPRCAIEPIFTHLRTQKNAINKQILFLESHYRVTHPHPTTEQVSRARLFMNIAYSQKLAPIEELVGAWTSDVFQDRPTALHYYKLALEFLPYVDTPLRWTDRSSYTHYYTLLALACKNGVATTIVDLLIERGASLSLQIAGQIPEQIASKNGHGHLAAHIRTKRLAQGVAPS